MDHGVLAVDLLRICFMAACCTTTNQSRSRFIVNIAVLLAGKHTKCADLWTKPIISRQHICFQTVSYSVYIHRRYLLLSLVAGTA